MLLFITPGQLSVAKFREKLPPCECFYFNSTLVSSNRQRKSSNTRGKSICNCSRNEMYVGSIAISGESSAMENGCFR